MRKQENRCDIPLKRIASAVAAATGATEGDREDTLPPSWEETVVRLVDCPGHQRLRPHAIATAAASSLLIFIVDASDKPSLKPAAESA